MRVVQSVRVSKGVLVITLNEPPANAMTDEMMEQLSEVAENFATTDATVAVLTGGTRGFCTPMRFVGQPDANASSHSASRWLRILDMIRTSPIPMVAAIGGPCVGPGIGLIAQCDLRVAIESAEFSLPEIDPAFVGDGIRLRRLIGEGGVRKLIFTGLSISANQAHRLGLIDMVVPQGQWSSEPLRLATEIAAKGDKVVRLIKESLDRSEEAGLERGYEVELEYTERLRESGLARYFTDGPESDDRRG